MDMEDMKHNKRTRLVISEVVEDSSDEEGEEVNQEVYMDPNLWCNLQYHLDLGAHVFPKVPLREFFQLRLVCKDWNHLADDRQFLERNFNAPMQKPYFHLQCRGPDYQLHGLLTYSSWSKTWNYTSLGQPEDLLGMVALEGLMYFYNGDDHNIQRVFNAHSRVWYTLPPPPRPYPAKYLPVVALKVDTSSHPYNFLVIQVGGGVPTQVYDSRTNTWELRSLTDIHETPYKATCAQVKDCVYVRSDLDEVFSYDIRGDVWLSFEVTPGELEDFLFGVGAWKDRVFHLSRKYRGKWPDMEFELIMYVENNGGGPWEEFDRMPHSLRDWLTDGDHLDSCVDKHAQILSSYCDELVLIYSYWDELGEVNRFVFYNLETRVWQKANIPSGIVDVVWEHKNASFAAMEASKHDEALRCFGASQKQDFSIERSQYIRT